MAWCAQEMQLGAALKVLLVDDEPGFVDVLARRMNRRGVATVGVMSGAEALRALRREDFDCVVLDSPMTETGGIEMLPVLRAMVPEMPVLMLTGHGSEDVALHGLSQGASECLTKPCGLERLLDAILAAVRGAGRG